MTNNISDLSRPLTKFTPLFFIWIWLSLILSLGLAWHSLAKVDFGYVIWYEYGGIKEFINNYAPQNNYKKNFDLASEQQQINAFHEIVYAIQNHGEGLAKISYQVGNNNYLLLRNAEVIHLQDVANLIDWLNKFLVFSFILWLIIFLYQLKYPFVYGKKATILSIVGGGALLALPLIIFGATKVFYQFHIWVFPDNHQWFFYYQDSLMSTMMKAPDIFAYIALSLVFTTLIIYLIFYKLAKILHKLVK